MEYTLKKNIKDSKTDFFKAHRYIIKGKRYSLTGFTVSMNQNGGIHKGGFAVLCHRNGGSESPGILTIFYFAVSYAQDFLLSVVF